MTREEKLQKAHQMFDNRELLIELKWQREYFKRGYISNQEELFNLWIFDECIKTLEQEPVLTKIRAEIAEILKKYPMTMDYENGLKEALAIIDKYKAENELLKNI